METHPDVASSSSSKNADLFKQISEAHSVLSNEIERKRYDFEVADAKRFGGSTFRRNASGAASGAAGGGFRNGNQGRHPIEVFVRPRNILIGATMGIATVALLKSTLFPDSPDKDEYKDEVKRRGAGMKKLVEAWKNPKTGEWEQPAPWDATYQKLRPKLELVPREQVRQRRI
eukprot:404465-Ditylum_brightwellii.AAC.1